MLRGPVIVGSLGLAFLAGPTAGALAQSCPADVAAWQNQYDAERVRHGDAMTALKNQKDQIETERQVAYNNCPRGDNDCLRKVRETFTPRLTEIKNKETIENSRHRQEERTLGQVKRDCKLYDRMDKRTKSP